MGHLPRCRSTSIEYTQSSTEIEPNPQSRYLKHLKSHYNFHLHYIPRFNYHPKPTVNSFESRAHYGIQPSVPFIRFANHNWETEYCNCRDCHIFPHPYCAVQHTMHARVAILAPQQEQEYWTLRVLFLVEYGRSSGTE